MLAPVPARERKLRPAMAVMLLAAAPALYLAAPPQCSITLKGKGYSTNLDGPGSHGPMRYAGSAQDCCAFARSTAGCELWTWNGPPPGNGDCYCKASNSSIAGGSATMLSGSTRPGGGPPLPPSPLVRLTLPSGVAVVNTVLATYASWNIDSSCNRGFHHIHFANANLVAAAKGLAPSKLRFGGSGNDALVYGLSPGSPECKGIPPQPAGGEAGCGYITPGCLNASHWDSLHAFGEASSSEFIFGVAFGTNTSATYAWDPTNAGTLLDHIAAHKQQIFGFELGNEVNNNGGPGKTQPHQQADALRLFAPMVHQKVPGAVLIGPDSGYKAAEEWLKGYLPLVSQPGGGNGSLLHAVTHHVYDAPGRSSFNSPGGLDSGKAEIAWYTGVIKALAPSAEIWAGEDGPTGGGNDGTCGGNHSVCTTYASALTYADDLGLRARSGFVQYQRQSLFGGGYGLTDTRVFHSQSALGPNEPVVLRAGYWVNFLWKRILGRAVHNVSSSSPNLRAYAFSGPAASAFAAQERECAGAAALQLLLINLSDDENATVALPAAPADFIAGGATAHATGSDSAAWTLAPPTVDGSLAPFSTTVELNGVLLPDTIDGGAAAGFLGSIPVKAVKQRTAAEGLVLPPLSISFVCVGYGGSV
eukprot:SAG22_NODE_1598_length_4032_cov_1.979405_3_plen_644_part_00